jgi:hypothetical protein
MLIIALQFDVSTSKNTRTLNCLVVSFHSSVLRNVMCSCTEGMKLCRQTYRLYNVYLFCFVVDVMTRLYAVAIWRLLYVPRVFCCDVMTHLYAVAIWRLLYVSRVFCCDVMTRLYAVAIWRLLYASLVVCCDVMARLLTLFLLAGSLYRRNIRR